ncbi:MAG TPA: D-alanyl-D-alanine carboxypeptidase [Pyrinomonadaceae bacterium]|nr:D-alanyl-D-alanine carboxypeptidase [Pyrinomonadaceae bacterium]
MEHISLSSRIFTLITALVVILSPATVLAQHRDTIGPVSGAASETPIASSSLPTSRTSTGNPAAKLIGEPRVVYGMQGVLVETLEGETVATQAADALFNPASGIKLATALVALRTFGPRHRFTTGVWTDGTFVSNTGTLHGNLYISGRDPSFHYEHAVMISRQLNNLGINAITGDLVVPIGFTMNFSWSAKRSGDQLYESLDSTLRSAAATRAWLDDRNLVGDRDSQTVPTVAIMGNVRIDSVAPGARLLLAHRSSQLSDILKVLLCYSNNFMAERIGDSVGGTQSVQRQLISQLELSDGELSLSSLSGLGVNRASPRAMMRILRALGAELEKHNLTLADIMPVAGIDPGTLKERFVDLPWRGSVIAKTGTLIRTDRGVSSLIGQMRTATGESLLFVILNQRGNVLRFRENQDYLVMQIQGIRGGPQPFDYQPKPLAMILADRQSVLVSATEEYEPDHLPSALP